MTPTCCQSLPTLDAMFSFAFLSICSVSVAVMSCVDFLLPP